MTRFRRNENYNSNLKNHSNEKKMAKYRKMWQKVTKKPP